MARSLSMRSLNLYSPKSPESPGIVMGTRFGLIALKQLIERVLEEDVPQSINLQTSGGDDFKLIVGVTHAGETEKIQEPFTEEYFIDSSKCSPYEILMEACKGNIPNIEDSWRR